MRTFLLASMWLLVSGGAQAAILPFQGSLSFQFGPSGIVSFPVTGTGLATVNGSAGGPHVTALGIPSRAIRATALTTPVTDPFVAPIRGLQLTVSNGGGSFADGGLGLTGRMPLLGLARLCLGASCARAPANLSIPLSGVGSGGTVTNSVLINVTVTGSPWTTGTAAIGTLTSMGFTHGPASGTTSTASASGRLRLVTPIRIQTGIAGLPSLPSFARFDLHFVPEPRALVLLASGGFALAWAGARRR
ncbi:MAG: hypothetical protein QNK03_22575 [Myxococcota bacterium]|nr:hypothetical protein [Myxococcota bacterium]